MSGARTHWARCSIASSMPSSAQWMSSNASTSGRRLRHLLHAHAQRREERLAQPLGIALGGHELRRHLDSEQPADQRGLALARLAELVPVAEQPGHVGRELPPCLLGRVGVHDPALGAQHLAESPEHDARAVREAAPGAHRGRDRVLAEHALELAQQARLAHAGLADQADQVGRALAHHALVERLERDQLVVAAHQRRLVRGRERGPRCARPSGSAPPRRAPARPCPSARAARAPRSAPLRGWRAWSARPRSRCRAGRRSGAGTPRSRCRR